MFLDRFCRFRTHVTGRPTVRNREGAPAWSLSPEQALEQYAVTGCLRDSFYTEAGAQLSDILGLCAQVDSAAIARIAIRAHRRARMRDLPALLCVVLAARRADELAHTFRRVVDSPRMLRLFVRSLRSGVTGRRSLGSRPRRLVREWLASRSDAQLFRGATGTRPSLGDVIRIVHPRPATASRAALHDWLLGRTVSPEALPEPCRAWERFRRDLCGPLPDAPFERLSGLPLSSEQWRELAAKASWTVTRNHLNTFARHGVFEDLELTARLAARLEDPCEIAHARAMPHGIFAARKACGAKVPGVVTDALERALESSLGNVPRWEGAVLVCPDVSGSMSSPVTGRLGGATGTARCIDMAALFTAAILRRNPHAQVVAFADEARPLRLDPRAGVLEIVRRIAEPPGGGTCCSAPLAWANDQWRRFDLVVLVSDNESWMDPHLSGTTALLAEWKRMKRARRGARLVCLNLQPGVTSQAPSRPDVLNVGGFSDAVFDVITDFVRGVPA